MRAIAMILCAVTLASCQASIAPPDQDTTPLTGLWGADQIEIRDSTPAHLIVVQMPCQGFIFAGPVAVDSNGHFSAVGTLDRTYSLDLQGHEATLSGTEYPDSLALDLYPPSAAGGLSGPVHYSLKSGQHGGLTGYFCPL